MARRIVLSKGADESVYRYACEVETDRTIAEATCPLCKRPIGLDRQFYAGGPESFEGGPVHATCFAEAINEGARSAMGRGA